MKKIIVFLSAFLIVSTVFSIETIKFSTASMASYIEEGKPEQGLAGELYIQLFKYAGYKVEFEFFPLQRSNMNIETGEHRAGFGLRTSVTENIYYIPLLNVNRIIFYKKGIKVSFNEISDLKKYTISVLAGGDIEGALKKAGITVEGVNSYETLLKKVYAGRTDLGITPELAFYGEVRKTFPKQINDFIVYEKPFAIMDAGVAVSKKAPGWEKLSKDLETAFEKMKKDGTYLKIVEKYFGKGKATTSMIK